MRIRFEGKVNPRSFTSFRMTGVWVGMRDEVGWQAEAEGSACGVKVRSTADPSLRSA
jgi:hypothetical protein